MPSVIVVIGAGSIGQAIERRVSAGKHGLLADLKEENAGPVRQLTQGFGVRSTLECVGTEQSMLSAIGMTRPGGTVGRVGVPHYEAIPASMPAFFNNVTVSGGPAPVRAYMKELLPDIVEGRIHPGRVFDRTLGLDDVPEGYRNDRAQVDQGDGYPMTDGPSSVLLQ